jgi:Protein of unknown function (DUF3224)
MNLDHAAETTLCLLLTFTTLTHGQAKSKGITMHAAGSFDVKIVPQDDKLHDGVSRMLLDKQFHGDLEGTSKGQMLATGSAKSSGAYVALETVTGTLHGKTGSFVLYHTGIMTRGIPNPLVNVVPDSGTDQLQGIAGKMTINIAGDGKHSYDLEYTLSTP